jgi:integrase/recombinase XerD
VKRRAFRLYRGWHNALAAEAVAPESLWNTPGKKAPILTPKQIAQVERYILTQSNIPFADLLKFRLSAYAGLRVVEIAGISIADLVEKDGTISKEVTVRTAVGKGRKARKIPMHQKIEEAVVLFRKAHPSLPHVAFSQPWYTPKRQSVHSLTCYFSDMYDKAGLPNHSSHSGRRTFITNLAKNVGKQYTLRDVQFLAGHAQLSTTEQYIELSTNIVDLVGRLK